MPMRKSSRPAEDGVDVQEYEQLQGRYKKLETERIQAETRLEEASRIRLSCSAITKNGFELARR